MEETFYIDVWGDVICPFCYFGKRQLAKALEDFSPGVPVEVRYHAFELDPRAPASYDRTLPELLSAKYGMPVEQAEHMHRQSEKDALRWGMTWRMDLCQTGNTFDAHRVIEAGREQGLAEVLTEALMEDYFCEGVLISDRAALRETALSCGLELPNDFFDSTAFVDEVRADEQAAMEYGITGVPTMIIDGRFMFSGAQGPDAIRDVLERAFARRALLN